MSAPRPIGALALAMSSALVVAQEQQPEAAAAQAPSTSPTVSPQAAIIVQGRADDLVGLAGRASEGIVGQTELLQRPLLRAGEVLETVPGVIVTQHSAPGKSNQQFARGVNLDHGTDLRTTLFGIPLNMPSHGHGQGYTDLGPLIPELIDTVRYRLGPYDVRDGDFASVGAIDIDYQRSLPRGFFQVTGGSYDYARTVVADSTPLGDGNLLAALELQSYDGPFEVDQDYRKRNAYLAWSNDTLRLQAFAYEGSWTATDQIPQRAVADGSLGRFASLDPTSGGRTRWFGVSAEWQDRGGNGVGEGGSEAVDTYRVYAQHYDFDLFSNFTYFLEDPTRGDQIEQRDRRISYGGSYASEQQLTLGAGLGAIPGELQYGFDLRGDRIENGLFRSQRRQRTGSVRRDEIRQHRIAAYANLALEPSEWFRGYIGGRVDHYWFDVDSDRQSNSGTRDDGIVSGKAGVAFGPSGDTEVYANFGTGFHSNDARGVLQRDDPATAAPNDGSPVTPLVQSTGAELGVRTSAVAGLQSSLSLWALDLDQELVFVGDAGTTEPTRASRRYGIEWANHYRPLSWLTFDADLTWARGRYRSRSEDGSGGNRIPGAVPLTLSAGAVVDWSEAFSTAVRVRHFDGRPLTEDGSITSSSTTLVNARASFALDDSRTLQLDVLNLLDREASDIEYFYGSQLAGEANAVDDIHFHPAEPLSLRLTFVARF
ncbi:MAG: TonB-dependent receptor [Planctomycetota bacterium]